MAMPSEFNVTPINSFWVESFCASDDARITLPNIGHLLVVCPLQGKVSVGSTSLDSNHYGYFFGNSASSLAVTKISEASPKVMICCISPGFVQQISEFLNISSEFGVLLQGVPMPQGDTLSQFMHSLADANDPSIAEEIFMDVIGQVIELQRARHSALMSLSGQKATTQFNLIERLCKARQYIDARFLESFGVKDVAKACAISEYHFARLFKSAFSATVHQYVMARRLNHARVELECAERQITDIAMEIGYRSISAFNIAFRKRFGLSPSSYRKKHVSAKISRI